MENQPKVIGWCFSRIVPICTWSPVCNSDIDTDRPFSRLTLAVDGKQAGPDGGGVDEGGGGGGVVVVVVVVGVVDGGGVVLVEEPNQGRCSSRHVNICHEPVLYKLYIHLYTHVLEYASEQMLHDCSSPHKSNTYHLPSLDSTCILHHLQDSMSESRI